MLNMRPLQGREVFLGHDSGGDAPAISWNPFRVQRPHNRRRMQSIKFHRPLFLVPNFLRFPAQDGHPRALPDFGFNLEFVNETL